MENKEKHFISAVIYVHNDEKRIADFLHMVIDVLEKNFEHSEIICINDNSKDDSLAIIKKNSKLASHTSISVINLGYFHGLELAMNAGIDLAIGDFVLEFDTALLDFDKNKVMEVYHKSLEGYDIVSAIPDKKQKKSSKFFYYIFDKFARSANKMYTERFRILSRRAINRVSSMNKTIPYRKVIYACCGLKTQYILYHVAANDKRKENIEKEEKKYRRRLAVDTLILFTDIGYRFSVLMTTIMMLVTIVMAVYSMVIYLVSTPIRGWTTTILFMAFAFFGLFGILTVIIKYLQILVDLVFKRKRYNFEEIEKLTK